MRHLRVPAAPWPLEYPAPGATPLRRSAVGPDGSLVLVGADDFGWHTAKIAPDGATEWVRSRAFLGSGESAHGASVAPNGAITVVGDDAELGACAITRFLSDGIELEDTWLRTLPDTASCRHVASDDERVYFPTGSWSSSGEGALHVYDANSGNELAVATLPGAALGADMLTLAPGGGVLVGHHNQIVGGTTRSVTLVDEEGVVLWQHDLPGHKGAVGARADGELIASVTAPAWSAGTTEGEVSLQWYRRSGEQLVECGSHSLGSFTNPLVGSVIAFPDGSFAVWWGADLATPLAERWFVAKVHPVAEGG